VAGIVAIETIISPDTSQHLLALATAGAVRFFGQRVTAQIRLRNGRRLEAQPWSPTATTPELTVSSA
jgi:hypothetical protein